MRTRDVEINALMHLSEMKLTPKIVNVTILLAKTDENIDFYF